MDKGSTRMTSFFMDVLPRLPDVTGNLFLLLLGAHIRSSCLLLRRLRSLRVELPHRGFVIARQEGDALAVEGVAHRFEMHQVRGPADLDVALDGRSGESVEQPSRALVANETVPFAAKDRDRRLDQSRGVGEIAVPGVQNVGEWAGRSFHPGRISIPTVGIAVEIALAPFVEMRAS